MADFVAEIRPRSYAPQIPTPLSSGADFVAEIRPLRSGISVARQPVVSCQGNDFSDSYLQNVLTERQFSREGITQLIRGSVITLIEKVLTGRAVARVEGNLRIMLNNFESPLVVDLNHNINSDNRGGDGHHIDRTLEANLKFKHRNGLMVRNSGFNREGSPMLGSCLNEHEREFSRHSQQSKCENLSGYSGDEENSISSPIREEFFRSTSPEDVLDLQTSFHQTEGRSLKDSDDESGYTSSEKDDSESSLEHAGYGNTAPKQHGDFNDDSCSDFSGSSPASTMLDVSSPETTPDTKVHFSPLSLSQSSDEMEEDDDDEDIDNSESRLMIDECEAMNSKRENVDAIQEAKQCLWQVTSKSDISNETVDGNATKVDASEDKSLCCLHEREGVKSPIGDEISDIDVVGMSPGNSRFPSDVESVVLTRQWSDTDNENYVSKNGRCLSPEINTDIAEMSSQNQSKHGLYSCPQCCRTFTIKNNLKRHMKLHTGLKPYKCLQCSQSFARKDDLKEHLFHHDNSKCYQSNVNKKENPAVFTVENPMTNQEKSQLLQNKIRICDVCRKQFKNKSNFQEHILTHHKVEVEKSFLGSITPETMTERDSALWHVKSQSKCSLTFAQVGTYEGERSGDVSKEISQVTPQPDNEIMDDEFQGQLLDLSMKKPTSSNLERSQENLQKFSTSLRNIGCTEQNISRNGDVASEPLNLGQGREQLTEAIRMTPAISFEGHDQKYKDGYNKGYIKSELESQFRDHWQAKSYNFLERVPIRPKSAEKTAANIDSGIRTTDRRPLSRTLSHEHRLGVSVRFSPYMKEKMADLAAKFVAARGSEIHGVKIPIKSLAQISENKETILPLERANKEQQNISALVGSKYMMTSSIKGKDGLIRNWLPVERNALGQINNVPFQTDLDRSEASQDNSNPETALKCHIRSVVKSEIFPEPGLNCDSARGNRYLNSIHEDISSAERNIYQPRVTHECEACTEQFCSFSDLETHSVEVHKRYLCEHCRKSFTARPNRDRHVRYHTGERPYRCDICEMAFFRGDDLKYHRTTRHPTAQPFVCLHCSASFVWSRDLEKHVRHSKCKPVLTSHS